MYIQLGYDILRVTEAAAVESAKWRGRGDKNEADRAATEAMRNVLNSLDIKGTVVIGEGEMDEAPMLYNGEVLGKGGVELDIAVDPLDGTTLTSKNRENAITVIALAEKGSLLKAPDMYMMKLGVGPKAKGAIDLSKNLSENLKEIAKALKKQPEEINIVMLDRERHSEFVKESRDFGAKVTLISDGDVSPILGTGLDAIDMDILFGVGGAPEGVLAAAAAKCLGGDFQGKLWTQNDEEFKKCKAMGIKDPNKIYTIDEMVKTDHVIFCLTGVTSGFLVKGIENNKQFVISHSLLLNSLEKKIRYVGTHHKI